MSGPIDVSEQELGPRVAIAVSEFRLTLQGFHDVVRRARQTRAQARMLSAEVASLQEEAWLLLEEARVPRRRGLPGRWVGDELAASQP